MHIFEHIISIDNLQGIGNKVIVLVDELPQLSEFIITPEMGGRKPVTGTIISIGKDVNYCNIGDRIFFTRFTGREFTYEEKKYQILVEDEIFAVVPSEIECEETPHV